MKIRIFQAKNGKIYLKKKEKNKQDLLLQLDLDIYDVVLYDGLIFFYPKKNGKKNGNNNELKEKDIYTKDIYTKDIYTIE